MRTIIAIGSTAAVMAALLTPVFIYVDERAQHCGAVERIQSSASSGHWTSTVWSYYTRDNHLCGMIRNSGQEGSTTYHPEDFSPSSRNHYFSIVLVDHDTGATVASFFEQQMTEVEVREMLQKACDEGVFKK